MSIHVEFSQNLIFPKVEVVETELLERDSGVTNNDYHQNE